MILGFTLTSYKHKLPASAIGSMEHSSRETCLSIDMRWRVVPTSMLSLSRIPSFHLLNSSPPCKFPILHSHLGGSILMPLTAFASLSPRIKGLSDVRVSPVLEERPPVRGLTAQQTQPGSGLRVGVGLWGSLEGPRKNEFICNQETRMKVKVKWRGASSGRHLQQ